MTLFIAYIIEGILLAVPIAYDVNKHLLWGTADERDTVK